MRSEDEGPYCTAPAANTVSGTERTFHDCEEFAPTDEHNREDHPVTTHVSSHHRSTIEKVFRHPTGGNIEWRAVLAMLEGIGAVTEESNGKFTVVLGPETEVFETPRGKDIDEQATVDLRRMLRGAGFAPTPDTR